MVALPWHSTPTWLFPITSLRYYLTEENLKIKHYTHHHRRIEQEWKNWILVTSHSDLIYRVFVFSLRLAPALQIHTALHATVISRTRAPRIPEMRGGLRLTSEYTTPYLICCVLVNHQSSSSYLLPQCMNKGEASQLRQ